MRAELTEVQESLTKLAQNGKGRLAKIENQLNVLKTQVATLTSSLRLFEREQTELDTAIADRLVKKQTNEPLALLTMGGGVAGDEADFLVGLTARTEAGRASLSADRRGVAAYGEAVVLPALALFGRYTQHVLAPQGISGIR